MRPNRLNQWTTKRPAPGRLHRPTLERLEDRLAPAVFTVTNTNDSGTGSLRQALGAANGAPNGGGVPDEIHFNIPGAVVHTITPQSQLPTIADPVVIDGYTQPGASPNTNGPGQSDNAVLQIEIDGSIGNQNGLVLSDPADGSTIRGLDIDRGFGFGILISANKITVEGCFIGVDPSGAKAQGNGTGIAFGFGQDTSNGQIGGTTPAARNVISGNSRGLFLLSGNQTVQGNLIGTDASGLVGLPNATGVEISLSGGHLIGGSTAGARNVINGTGQGIVMSGGASANMVQGNFIQVLNDGVTPGASATNAVFIENGTTGNQIGGLTSTPGTGLGNVIGPCFIGIQAAGANHKIQGNLIGTDATGTKALGIGQTGIALFGNASTTIGGPTADTRNVIAGCGGFAIQIDQGLTATPPNKNLVQNNFIGTDINGVPGSMGNGGGVLLQSSQSAANNQVLNNVIAGNAGHGVVVNPNVTNTAIQGNSLFANGGLAINLVGGTQDAFGVTANDLGDGDSGPNGLQNYPVITTASIGGASTTVGGTLNSLPGTNFRIEFFANAGADLSTFGEGKRFLGAVNVTTDGAGNATFNATSLAATMAGEVVTTTATNLTTTETSEFSKSFPTVSAQVAAVVVNGGVVQRSRVLSVEVSFTQTVTLPANPANAFTLARNSDNAPVSLAAFVNNTPNTVVTLTFTGGATNFGSLADGRYTLSVLASQVSNVNGQLDGNGDGVAGDDFVRVGAPANGLFRLFGDIDGDGDVDPTDFGAFRAAFGGVTDPAFDFDGDGDVDASDFGQFRRRFGAGV